MAESKRQQQNRFKRRYILALQYIKNKNSPKEYLSLLREKGVTFDEKEIKQKKVKYPFNDLDNGFEVDVIGFWDIEKTILRTWCSWAKEKETFGWISIKSQQHFQLLEGKARPVTTIKNAAFCVGAFKSPTGFCQHCPDKDIEDCSVVFEHATDTLSIVWSTDSKTSYRFELSERTFINSAVISKRREVISVYIETDQRFKLSILKGSTIATRTILVDDIRLRKSFGLSSVFKITFSDETLDVAMAIVAYLKRKDINVVYARVELEDSLYSRIALSRNIKFNDFETEYAWQCLLHRGYKVIDSIDSDVIDLLKRKVNSDLTFTFHVMESMVDCTIFFNFKHYWREASKRKEDRNAEHESHLSKHLYVRRIVVTPTSEIYFRKEPTKENRVTLQFNVDYFLRIVFRDEDFSKLQVMSGGSEDGIIDRVKTFLRKGIRIGDRHFEFLGCSNSQMREHGAWFVAEHDGNTAESIRKSLGDFTKERCVAAYVSRLGLCFSTSWKTVNVDQCEFIGDVENNGYCFTDGIGKMSESLAKKISSALQVPQPSAFQIRYAGCKGVIALNPDLGQEERMVVRDSMLKFKSPSKTLEILHWTRPGQLFLNRQVITLMSGLGVPDEAFLSLQQKVLLDLATMLIDEDLAFDELRKVLKNIQYKNIRKNGVRLNKDPFFRSILVTIYKYRVDGILKKSRIPIPWSQGRIMLGTVDETGKLNYGEVFISYSNTDEASKCKTVVHTGTVVVTKNPCFHPGDLRKFKAVDIPDLHHMVDCIVFPQKGERPHPDEMSGSDLDGDMYFVCWDQSFIPPNENETPMDFPKSPKKKLNREIRVEDVVEFLGDYMKNDRLGVIANTHVVPADMESIYSTKCLELAKLHSDAVDFAKTGKIPKINKDLIVEKYPDFMMKRDKEMYPSEKILGKLFRECELISKTIGRSKHSELQIENSTENLDFLQNGYEHFLQSAEISFNTYSQKIFDLMNEYGIKTEAELFTGMLLSMRTQRGCLKNEIFEISQLITTKLSEICKDTRIDFFKEFKGEQNATKNLNYVQAKASAWYKVSYGSRVHTQRCLSFPWLVGEFVVSKILQNELKCGFSEIGFAVVKHVKQRLNKREDLFHDVIRHIRYINATNPNIMKLPLVGVVPLCLISDEHQSIPFYTDCSETEDISTHSKSKFQTMFDSDPEVLRKTIFVKCILEKDLKTFVLLSYLMDWARDRKLINSSMHDELDFAYMAAHILYRDKDTEVQGHLSHESVNLSALDLKWTKDIRLNREDQYALGREMMQFLKEYLDHITNQNKESNVSKVTEVMDVFLKLSLHSSLEPFEYENHDERWYLPNEMWNHLLSAKEYVVQKMQEETNIPYVNIEMSKDGVFVLHAWGPYDKLKHIKRLMDQTTANNSLFISTPTRDMVLVKDSIIITFEGYSGKDDILEYIPHKDECNFQHKKYHLAIPCLQRTRRHKEIMDYQMFEEAYLKQIKLVRDVYNQLFHGKLSMKVVLGRFYLINAPNQPTTIQTFEKKIAEIAKENEKIMQSGTVKGYKLKKLQRNQTSFLKKSFKPIHFNFTKSLEILRANGFELQRLNKSYKVRLNLDKPVFGKCRNCMVSLDETFELKHVTLDDLVWAVADVVREKHKSKSLADIRLKLTSKRKLNKEIVRKIEAMRELLDDRKPMLKNVGKGGVKITKGFAYRIPYVKEKTLYSCNVPGPKSVNLNLRISSIVEYNDVDRDVSGRTFQAVEKRNEVSFVPKVPDLSHQADRDSFLRFLWEFSFHLSDILDVV